MEFSSVVAIENWYFSLVTLHSPILFFCCWVACDRNKISKIHLILVLMIPLQCPNPKFICCFQQSFKNFNSPIKYYFIMFLYYLFIRFFVRLNSNEVAIFLEIASGFLLCYKYYENFRYIFFYSIIYMSDGGIPSFFFFFNKNQFWLMKKLFNSITKPYQLFQRTFSEFFKISNQRNINRTAHSVWKRVRCRHELLINWMLCVHTTSDDMNDTSRCWVFIYFGLNYYHPWKCSASGEATLLIMVSQQQLQQQQQWQQQYHA